MASRSLFDQAVREEHEFSIRAEWTSQDIQTTAFLSPTSRLFVTDPPGIISLSTKTDAENEGENVVIEHSA